jgi:hypothetical protein
VATAAGRCAATGRATVASAAAPVRRSSPSTPALGHVWRQGFRLRTYSNRHPNLEAVVAGLGGSKALAPPLETVWKPQGKRHDTERPNNRLESQTALVHTARHRFESTHNPVSVSSAIAAWSSKPSHAATESMAFRRKHPEPMRSARGHRLAFASAWKQSRARTRSGSRSARSPRAAPPPQASPSSPQRPQYRLRGQRHPLAMRMSLT